MCLLAGVAGCGPVSSRGDEQVTATELVVPTDRTGCKEIGKLN